MRSTDSVWQDSLHRGYLQAAPRTGVQPAATVGGGVGNGRSVTFVGVGLGVGVRDGVGVDVGVGRGVSVANLVAVAVATAVSVGFGAEVGKGVAGNAPPSGVFVAVRAGADVGLGAVAAASTLGVEVTVADGGAEAGAGDFVGSTVASTVAPGVGVGVGSDPPPFRAIAPTMTAPRTPSTPTAAPTSHETPPLPDADEAGLTDVEGDGPRWGAGSDVESDAGPGAGRARSRGGRMGSTSFHGRAALLPGRLALCLPPAFPGRPPRGDSA